jgi:hypothetical protein
MMDFKYIVIIRTIFLQLTLQHATDFKSTSRQYNRPSDVVILGEEHVVRIC